MRSVNANLLEINQAKSRINQAKKEGKTNVYLNAPTTPDNTPGGSTPSGGSSTTEGGSGNTEYRKKKYKMREFLRFYLYFCHVIQKSIK